MNFSAFRIIETRSKLESNKFSTIRRKWKTFEPIRLQLRNQMTVVLKEREVLLKTIQKETKLTHKQSTIHEKRLSSTLRIPIVNLHLRLNDQF